MKANDKFLSNSYEKIENTQKNKIDDMTAKSLRYSKERKTRQFATKKDRQRKLKNGNNFLL